MLTLYIGPMCSNKTSSAISECSRLAAVGAKIVFLNSMKDIRSSDGFSTHNPALQPLSNITYYPAPESYSELPAFEEYDTIGCDEINMHTHVREKFIEWMNAGKVILAAGLKGSSNLTTFGEIDTLYPIATKIIDCSAICKFCYSSGKYKIAAYTARLVKSDSLTDVGGLDKYAPCCWKHHREHNVVI